MQKNKGISLIVLVITIIVMIILAGSIIITLSNSGIINKANDAVEMSNEAQIKEMATAELILNGWYSGQDFSAEQVEALKKQFGEGVKQLRNDTLVLTKDGTTITLYATGDMLKGEVELWDGSSSVPEIKEGKWYIYKASELKFLADFVNNGGTLTEAQKTAITNAGYAVDVYKIEATTEVYLMADLDLGGRKTKDGNLGEKWTPIANTNKVKFEGIFNGNDHVIKGVYVSVTGNYAGLFGRCNIVTDLTVKDSYVKATGGAVGAITGTISGDLDNCHNINTEVIGGAYAIGGVIGQFTGDEILNCTNSGYVWATDTYTGGDNQMGGIVGRYTGNKIQDCTNFGRVEAKGKWIGGIVGIVTSDRSKTNIINCINSGEISGKTSQVGGIAGITCTTVDINNCKNDGNVKCDGERVGGIVGETAAETSSTVVKNCINTAQIYGTNKSVGGIIGALYGTVENCYNTGNIKQEGSEVGYIGGIVGSSVIDAAATIKNTYNVGTISAQGTDVSSIGGIIGRISATDNPTLTNNYNIGKIEAKGKNVELVGGILGFANTDTINEDYNYYIEGTQKTEENTYGESKTASFMKTIDFVKDLNTGLATEVWEIRTGENNGYPVFKK